MCYRLFFSLSNKKEENVAQRRVGFTLLRNNIVYGNYCVKSYGAEGYAEQKLLSAPQQRERVPAGILAARGKGTKFGNAPLFTGASQQVWLGGTLCRGVLCNC